MAYPKGKKRPEGAGRKPGTLNKATLAEQACLRAGIDPFDLLVRKAVEGSDAAIVQLCKHIEPPRKPLDVALDPNANKLIMEIFDYTDKK